MPQDRITAEDVARMAHLSRLNITPAQKDRYAQQFANILGYMDILAHVDTQNTDPLYSPALHTAQPREDNTHTHCTSEDILANAPHTNTGAIPQENTYFVVPRIV